MSVATPRRVVSGGTTLGATVLAGTALETTAPVRWHRPLLWLAATMAVVTVVVLVLRFVDPREITGVNAWDKPLKFAISTVVYSVTWSWLIGQLTRFQRAGRVLGAVIVAMFAIELALIIGAAAFGVTSHFNVSTPLATAVWAVMGVSITVLWIATLLVSGALWMSRLGDRARTVAIRSGALIALLGLGLAFLMTGPTPQQLDDFRGIVGAHSVGTADGGPGLPILGWSTVAGDLRIPHFVGMHALQVIPLTLIALELMARRVAVLREVVVRSGLLWTVALGYLAVIGLLTWQALRGQSIVQPDAATLTAAGVIVFAMVVSTLAILVRGRRSRSPTELPTFVAK